MPGEKKIRDAVVWLSLAGALSPLWTPCGRAQSPSLASISPSSVPAGADATITLQGANLASGANVVVGGNILSNAFCFSGSCPISYVSISEMTVALPASTLASPGELSIAVETASGAVSNSLTLTVTTGGATNNPAPTLISISPATAVAGGKAFALTVQGSGFVAGSKVEWNGSSRLTTYISGTQISASIAAGDIASPGTAGVTVVNPPPGGGTSASLSLVITAGVSPGPPATQSPVITWILPLTTTAGGPEAALTVYGANFSPGSTVEWNGAARDTTFVNSNQLQVHVSAAGISSPGTATISVAGSNGSSGAWSYPVISPGVAAFAAGPEPIGLAPVAAAVDSVLGRIYVVQRGVFRDVCLNGPDCANWPSDVVTVADQRSGGVLATIGIGASTNGQGQGIAVDSTRHRVFVTNADDDTVTVIDGLTNSTVATTTVDHHPEGIAVDPDRGIVYVAAANITLLDASNGQALGSVPAGAPAWAVAVDRTSHLAYVLVHSIPQALVAIDGSGASLKAQVALSPFRYTYSGIAVDPGFRAYACDYNSGAITPIDISGSIPALLPDFSGTTPYAEAVAVDESSHRLLVVSSGSAVVDSYSSGGAKAASAATLRVPVAVAVDQGGGAAYVVDSQSDSLSMFALPTLRALGTIPLGIQAMSLAFDPVNGHLYAANYIADAVSVIDPARASAVSSWTSGGGTWSVGVDPALQEVFAANSSDGTVSIFSSADGSLKDKLSAGAKGTSVVAVNRATHVVYVSSGTLNGAVAAIDARTNQILSKISAGDTPVGIAIDEEANRIFVASQHSGTIRVIDGYSNQVVATWHPPLGNVWKLAFDPALGRLYASVPPTTIGSFSGLEVLDSSTGELLSQVSGGFSAPEDVAVNPKTHHVLVSDSGNGTVWVIDAASGTILNSYVTGTAAMGLAVDASSGLVYVSNPFDATIGVFADQAAGSPPPSFTAAGIVSAASGSAGLAAGAIAVIYGSNLAPNTVIAPEAPWPTKLGGVSVLVNGAAAPLFYVSSNQIALQLPWEASGQVSVVVVTNGVPGSAVTVQVGAATPAIFSINQQGTGQGAIQISNSAFLAAPGGSIVGAQSRPAARGEYITIYCTGLGAVTNKPASGSAASANPMSWTTAPLALALAGISAPVIFSGLAPGFVGLYQVNAQVPEGVPAGSAIPVVLSIGGVSSNTVTMAVQ